MRIIAGLHRGRKLVAPPGLATRPMLDRVREALFSSLQPEIPGVRVLDLFAGTGSLGLEALSRGAERARMIESRADALRALRANVESLELGARAEIRRGDALDPGLWRWEEPGAPRARIAFFDPPYSLLETLGTRQLLFRTMHRIVTEALEPGGVLIFHAPHRAVRDYEFDPALAARERHYGTSSLWYLRQAGAPPDAPEGDRP